MKPKPPSVDQDSWRASSSRLRPKRAPHGVLDRGISRRDVPSLPLDLVSQVKNSGEKRWQGSFLAKTNDVPHTGNLSGFSFFWIALSMGSAHIYRRTPEATYDRQLDSNAISIIEPGMPIEYALKNEVQSFHYYLKPEVMREVALEQFDVDADAFSLVPVFGEPNGNLRDLLGLLSNLLNEPQRLSQLKADYISRAVAAEILSSYAIHVPKRQRGTLSPTLSPAMLRIVDEFVEAHMHEDIDIADLAAVCGIGKTSFHQRFKTSVQTTPYRYVMRARIHRAKHLILQTNLPLAEVAISCGFSDQAHLTNVFRRAVGVTPAAFRRATL